MQKLLLDCRTGAKRYVDLSPEELVRREADEADDRVEREKQQAAEADDAALGTEIAKTALLAVGQKLDALTAGQVRGLLALLLWRFGAIGPDLRVRPFDQWSR